MADEIPRDVGLKMQLAAIAGNEPASSYFELRPLTTDGRPATRARAFVPVRQLDESVRRIGQMVCLNAFVGAAPRVQEDGTAESIERVWTLWADLDGRDALERLRDFRPLPAIVVRTGSEDSAHAYWPLRAALSPHWAQRANRRLALALGSDMAATDPARILRPVGSFNHKRSPAREVVCTRLALDVFTCDQVVGELPDTDHYTQRPPAVGRQVGGDASRVLEGLSQTVAAAQEGNRNASLYWAVRRAREHADLGELEVGEALAELREAALSTGLGELEVERTIRSAMTAMAKVAA